MAKIELQGEYSNISTDECFNTCVSLVEEIGYKLFKKRDIANLIICNAIVENARVDLTLSVPFGATTSVRVNLSSEELDEDALNAEAERILGAISSKFSNN